MPVHAASNDYDLAGLAADPKRLSPVVTYDRPWLGDLSGLDVVHLQCHIGTDTLSLARLGGRVTGVDFSPERAGGRARPRGGRRRRHPVRRVGAVRRSRRARAPTSTSCTRGSGALNWLPDIAGWARVVAGLLRPGGRLYVRDGHPMLYTLYGDERSTTDDALRVTLPYFEGNAQHWVSERDLHRRPAGGLARAVRVEPRDRRDRAGRDRRRTPGDRAAGAHRAANGRACRRWSRAPTASSACPRRTERLPLMFTLEAAAAPAPAGPGG